MHLITLKKLKDYNLFSSSNNKLIMRALLVSSIEIKVFLKTRIFQIETLQLFNHFKEKVEISEINLSDTGEIITIKGKFEPGKNYSVKISNEDISVILDPKINGILDSDYYSDDQNFGVSIKGNIVKFKFWSPPAVQAELLLFDKNQIKLNTPKTLLFKNTKRGIWEIQVEPKDIGLKSLDGIYYQYKIFAYGKEIISLDPYAVSMAVFNSSTNDKIGKAAIINIKSKKANPPGFKKVYSNSNFIANKSDIIAYEINVRDFTIQAGIIDEKIAGTFKGLIEKINYLKELGITHVQLMPVNKAYTQNESDRTFSGKSAKESRYNWGYDPMNYFTLEGRYSTNPYDPYQRIFEFKEMVHAIHNAGIGVILDVVFNHTYIADTFENIAAGCYYRYTEEYMISGHTGAGASIESRRKQVRKFITDVLKFYVSEYHIDGFRFDLMSFTDKETMRQIRNIVGSTYNKNDKNDLILQGEAWNFTDLKNDAFVKTDFESLNIGIFNDTFRDSLAGNGFNHGFIQGNTQESSRLASSVIGGINSYDSSNLPFNKDVFFDPYNLFAKEPGDCLNFLSIHDGLTLWDKINLSVKDVGKKERLKLIKFAYAILLTSQGKIILHGGDEILRTKPLADYDKEIHRALTSLNTDIELDSTYFHENSYCSNDYTNMFRWDRLSNNYAEIALELLEYVKGLIKMRRHIQLFRLDKTQTVNKNFKFINDTSKNEFKFHSFRSYQLDKLKLTFKNGTPEKKYYLVGEIHKGEANPINNKYVLQFDKNGLSEITFDKNDIKNFDLTKWDSSRNLNFKLVETPGNWDYPNFAYTAQDHNSISPECINEHFELEIDLSIKNYKMLKNTKSKENNYIAYTIKNTLTKDISGKSENNYSKQIIVIHNPGKKTLKLEINNVNLKNYFVIADGKNAGTTKLADTEIVLKENYVLIPNKSSAVLTCK